MANERIVYKSQEIYDTIDILNNLISILQNDIQGILNYFSILKELDLFSDGLDSLKKETDILIERRNNLANIIKNHDDDLINFENLQKDFILKYDSNSLNSLNNGYTGDKVVIDSIDVFDVIKGKKIKTSELKEIVFEFNYDKKLEILKQLFSNSVSLENLLTDSDKANILAYDLKKILHDDTAVISDVSTQDEKDLQKNFLNSVVEDSQLFKDIDNKSFLRGSSYLGTVAKKNKITVGDLVIDDKNSDLFVSSLKELYADDLIPNDDLENVRGYLDNIAKINNITIGELLSSNKYLSSIKGGRQ